MTSLESFADLNNVDILHILEVRIAEMRMLQNQEVQIEFNDTIENYTSNFNILQSEEKAIETRVDYENFKNIYILKGYQNSFDIRKKTITWSN